MCLGLCCSAWQPYLPATSFEEPQRKDSWRKDAHVIGLDLSWRTRQWWDKCQPGRRWCFHVSTRRCQVNFLMGFSARFQSHDITSVLHVSGFLGDFRWSQGLSASSLVGLHISELKNGTVKPHELACFSGEMNSVLTGQVLSIC